MERPTDLEFLPRKGFYATPPPGECATRTATPDMASALLELLHSCNS